ncbi:helix-turn-helix transcriptional regulator [Sphingomonas colocasiae]|nr:AraC family transcriptional regulator [Sphingomonas colocasiae]
MDISPTITREEPDPTLSAMVEPDRILTRQAGQTGLLGQTALIRANTHSENGWSRGATIRPGFSIVLTEVDHLAHEHYAFLSHDHLKLHCKLDGSSLIRDDAEHSSAVESGRLSFLVQPMHTVKHEIVKPDTRTRAVTMVCSRDFLRELIPDSEDLPSILLDYLRGPVNQFCHRDAPLPLPMRAIVEDMLQLQSDRMADLMLEAKALELLYLSLRQLSGDGATDPVRPKSRQKVLELCEILQSGEGAAMSIAQLCRQLAWNETQMMESFKQVTGMTISGYRQRARMDEALRQLRTTDRSVTEIAFDAGYEHSSNFATAFKRIFGFSPKMARAQLN